MCVTSAFTVFSHGFQRSYLSFLAGERPPRKEEVFETLISQRFVDNSASGIRAALLSAPLIASTNSVLYLFLCFLVIREHEHEGGCFCFVRQDVDYLLLLWNSSGENLAQTICYGFYVT